MKNNRIIMTGDLQAGKSTVCRKILNGVAPAALFGFRTFRTSEGFALSDWNGNSALFATWSHPEHQNGDLRIDSSVFNREGINALSPPSERAWLAMDELGVMEQKAVGFVRAVRDAWAGPNPGIAVIQRRALDFWLHELGEGSCPVYEITPQNRDLAPATLTEMLSV